jgi:transglutaminase-like putative cysteine protease
MNELRPVSDIFRRKAEELVSGAGSLREAIERIAGFVRNDILYRLDEWDTKPEDVLKKGYGMCAGKALLAAELFRAIQIPIRFKVLQISGEEGLFNFITDHPDECFLSQMKRQDRECVLRSIRSLPPQRDHIIVQVFLDGEWTDLDLARDDMLDRGMRLARIWRQRRVLGEVGPFNSIDEWLKKRMQLRTVLGCRQFFFDFVNQQMDRIRHAGEQSMKRHTKVDRQSAS